MLSRRSRKLRTSEPTLPVIPANNIMLELTTPLEDGTVPLVNFLENTERFISEHSNVLLRVYELEREVTKYKTMFRRYDEYLEKKTVAKDALCDDAPICNKDPVVRTIRYYFKPINKEFNDPVVSNVVAHVEPKSITPPLISKLNLEIDQRLKANLQEMDELLTKMKKKGKGVIVCENYGIRTPTPENNSTTGFDTNAQSKQETTDIVNYHKIDNIRLSYDSSETKTMFTSSSSIFGLIKRGDILNIVDDDTKDSNPSDYLVVKQIHSSRKFETTTAATNLSHSAAESPNLFVRQIHFRQSSEQVSSAM